MKTLFTIFMLISLYATLISCSNSGRCILKYKNERVKISLYESTNPDARQNRYEFYAKVDSSLSRFYFIFQPNQVYKLYENNQSLIYSLTYEENPKQILTGLDKMVLTFAELMIDSLRKNNLHIKPGATGFVEEINRH